jgi:hypothetical protein
VGRGCVRLGVQARAGHAAADARPFAPSPGCSAPAMKGRAAPPHNGAAVPSCRSAAAARRPRGRCEGVAVNRRQPTANHPDRQTPTTPTANCQPPSGGPSREQGADGAPRAPQIQIGEAVQVRAGAALLGAERRLGAGACRGGRVVGPRPPACWFSGASRNARHGGRATPGPFGAHWQALQAAPAALLFAWRFARRGGTSLPATARSSNMGRLRHLIYNWIPSIELD